jgi:hypothetical protein
MDLIEPSNNVTPQTDNKIYDTDFGFIMTRHVNSEITNKYWNLNAKLLNKFYPKKLIVIIDDNSNNTFLKPLFKLQNILIISSKYPKRGELLPYIYFLTNKWFDRAVIIHDGIFFHRRIPFDKINTSVVPLWHFNNNIL